MATKSPDAFRTISEVAEWLETPAHVLRFWESKFSQVKPVKRAGGRRYYRPSDMALIGGIKTLLHDEGMTIKGVQKLLREQGVKHVTSFSPPLAGEAPEREPEEVHVLPFQPRRAGRTRGPVEDAEELPLFPLEEETARASPTTDAADDVPARARKAEETAPAAVAEEEEASAAAAPQGATPPPGDATHPPLAPPPRDSGVPSFLRPRATATGTDAPAARDAPFADGPGTADASPAIRAVTTPPDPADDALPAAAGLLSRLAKIHWLPGTQTEAAAAIASELRTLAARRADAARP